MGLGDGDLLEYQVQQPGPVFPRAQPTALAVSAVAYVAAPEKWGIDRGEPPLVYFADVVPGRRAPTPVREGAYAMPWGQERWGLDFGEPPGQARYPDVVPGRELLPLAVSSLTAVAYVPAPTRWGVDNGEPPKAFFPDVLPGRRLPPLPVELLTSVGYVPAIDRWGVDGGQEPWRGVFPDRVWGRRPNPTPDWVTWDPIARTVVRPTFISSTESFGVPEIQNFGALRLVAGASGPIEGGTDVQLSGGVLDMSGVEDTFSDGTVNLVLWTPVVTGSGVVTEAGGTVRLDSGVTAGSTAILRSAGTVENVDVEVVMRSELVSIPTTGTVRALSLGLRVDASNEFRLDIEATRTTATLRIFERLSGMTVVNQTVALGAAVGTMTLRITRVGGRVIALVNGAQVADSTFASAAAAFEMLVGNDAAASSRVVGVVTRYVRAPSVAFGDVPALVFLLRTEATLVVDAPARSVPGAVDIVVTGTSATETLTGGFRYTADDRKVVGRTATTTLVVLNDPTLKRS